MVGALHLPFLIGENLFPSAIALKNFFSYVENNCFGLLLWVVEWFKAFFIFTLFKSRFCSILKITFLSAVGDSV
jgi:hypothetical protein